MDVPRRLARAVAIGLPTAAWLASATGVAAHGPAPDEPPSAANLLFGWTWQPLPTLGIAVAIVVWWWAVRRVDRAHPANPVPRRRTAAFLGAMAALAFALLSGIERYDTTLFSVHMVQHVLLMLVAAPLLALSAPITLLLRVASPEDRRRWILPVLHARVVRLVTHPIFASVAFTVVLWSTHFTAFFDAALEDPLLHDLEHALFLGTALLFWWPAVGVDPSPWRMSHPARIVYVFMQMAMNTFMSFVILGVPDVLYPHYATVVRTWGAPALDDQRLAAGIMWIAGDLIFLTAILGIVADWMRAEAADQGRSDRRAAEELAAIRVRERRLAERLAEERGKSPS